MSQNKNYLIVETKKEQLSFNDSPLGHEYEPLFKLEEKDDFIGLDESSENKTWFTYDLNQKRASWDAAHELVKNNSQLAYAEPDSIDYFHANSDEAHFTNKGYINSWGEKPSDNEFAWYLDDDRTELRKARHVDPGIGGNKIKIAHLDTGYDPNHVSLPKYIKTTEEFNFIEGGKPYDPESSGLLKQPGHGTGTIAILAGNVINYKDIYNDYMGGAPFAEIVPMRIAKSVVLVKNKDVARAIDYAIKIKCDVISMSMGGVPSKLWAKMINKAYNNGVVVVTAAGNNFSDLPIRTQVYPANFDRVIAACGMTYNNKPYYKFPNKPNIMQGNWGPKRKMKYALSAYTPNVPWAEINSINKFRKAGGGTSSATPQISAAAAIWLEHYKEFNYDYKWQRVEAVRKALFTTAKKHNQKFRKVGHGIVQAHKALGVAPFKSQKKASKAYSFLPMFRLLFRVGFDEEKKHERIEMYETEILQLYQCIPEINALITNIDERNDAELGQLTEKEQKDIKDILIETKYTSSELSTFLKEL